MRQAFQIAPGRMYRGVKPRRDRAYRTWIKRFACLACGSCRLVDACHSGPHGLSQKGDDYLCVPLCRKCHERFDADPRGFLRALGLDIARCIAEFQRLWALKQRSQSS